MVYYLQSHPDFSVVEAVSAFLQFIPMEDEIMDSFRPVATQILQKVRTSLCMPTQPNTEGNDTPMYRDTSILVSWLSMISFVLPCSTIPNTPVVGGA
jgi:hypothetical protein